MKRLRQFGCAEHVRDALEVLCHRREADFDACNRKESLYEHCSNWHIRSGPGAGRTTQYFGHSAVAPTGAAPADAVSISAAGHQAAASGNVDRDGDGH
jgi:hypothetical protein